jgi:lysophospholipase L1-like esterase
MKEVEKSGFGSVLGGSLGLILLPLLLVADTWWATRHGWPLRAAGAFRLFYLLSLASIVLVGFSWLIRPIRRWIAAHAAQLWLLSGGTIIGLLLGDLAVIPLVSPRAPFHLRTPDAVYSFNPNSVRSLPGVVGEAASTINSDGIRGPELPAKSEAYRILCIGGGATEGLYLDDDECWPAQLMQQLNQGAGKPVWVGNAGVIDFSSGHHLRFVRDSAEPAEVDCIVIMAGVNDLMRLLLGLDQGEGTPPIWFRSALVDLLKEIWLVHLGHGVLADYTGDDLIFKKRYGREIQAPTNGDGEEIGPSDFDAALQAYAARLRDLVAVAKARGQRVVLVSEPALWDFDLSPQAKSRLRFARTVDPREWNMMRADALREEMDRYNDELQKVAEEQDVEFVDASAKMSGLERYFYDDFDLSEAGAAMLAKLVAEQVQSKPLESNAE